MRCATRPATVTRCATRNGSRAADARCDLHRHAWYWTSAGQHWSRGARGPRRRGRRSSLARATHGGPDAAPPPLRWPYRHNTLTDTVANAAVETCAKKVASGRELHDVERARPKARLVNHHLDVARLQTAESMQINNLAEQSQLPGHRSAERCAGTGGGSNRVRKKTRKGRKARGRMSGKERTRGKKKSRARKHRHFQNARYVLLARNVRTICIETRYLLDFSVDGFPNVGIFSAPRPSEGLAGTRRRWAHPPTRGAVSLHHTASQQGFLRERLQT